MLCCIRQLCTIKLSVGLGLDLVFVSLFAFSILFVFLFWLTVLLLCCFLCYIRFSFYYYAKGLAGKNVAEMTCFVSSMT